MTLRRSGRSGLGRAGLLRGLRSPVPHAPGPCGHARWPAGAVDAMRYIIFHWGLHPWAIYIVLGLSMGYLCFRKGPSAASRGRAVPADRRPDLWLGRQPRRHPRRLRYVVRPGDLAGPGRAAGRCRSVRSVRARGCVESFGSTRLAGLPARFP
nr:BCCT family transporter [Haloechinothrix alba]